MKNFMKACILGASLILMLNLGGAASYGFGSKVVTDDTDMSRILYNFTDTPVLRYWDIGTAGYDEGDPVYLDLINNTANPNIIDANDLRLTMYNTYWPGTKVTASDNDINKPLASFTNPGIVFTDLYGITGYDFADPIYALNNVSPLTIRTNDVRLNRISTSMAGTKVLDYHPDHDKPATSLVCTYRFYNANGNQNVAGNPIYDSADDVYIDISTAASESLGFVVENDVRISQ